MELILLLMDLRLMVCHYPAAFFGSVTIELRTLLAKVRVRSVSTVMSKEIECY